MKPLFVSLAPRLARRLFILKIRTLPSQLFLTAFAVFAVLLASCDKAPEEKAASEKAPVEATPGLSAPLETPAPKAPVEAAPAPKAPVETAAAEKAPDAASATKEVAVIKTTMGEMVAEFWPDVAPKTVENFIQLAKSGFYDGTAFHRIIKGFMIQGGDPLTKDATLEDRWGTGSADHYVKAEFNDRHHVRGVLSMARAQNPDSASCQFFICLDDAPNLDGKYTAFGKLIKGEDVLMKLGDTPVAGPGNHPVTRAGIESIKIVPADSIK